MELVKFKSKPEFYHKEKKGIKPNTIRKQNFSIVRDFKDEERFEKLNKFMKNDINALRIIIQNTETGESFERSVIDVSYYDGLYIISWVHPRFEFDKWEEGKLNDV